MATNTAMLNSVFAEVEPVREEIDAMPGALVVEFDTGREPDSSAVQPFVESALEDHPGVLHIKVDENRGRGLGRSFDVSDWPTLVFLLDGREMGRVVRPNSASSIAQKLSLIDPVW